MARKIFSSPLKIVYFNGEVEISKRLFLDRLDQIWGIQLPNRICIALNDAEEKMDWFSVDNYVESLKGAQGILRRLPSASAFEEIKGIDEFNSTCDLLREHGVEAEDFGGSVWCYAKESSAEAEIYNLDYSKSRFEDKAYGEWIRIAAIF